MPLKNLRPVTPGTRNAVRPSFEEITKGKPEESLLSPVPSRGGRNNRGRVTARHRGGGPKRMYRQVSPVVLLVLSAQPSGNSEESLVSRSQLLHF